ncbi:response regulator [Bacteriovoracales bacterium]|nr:response regulator [Bacteriovoracales bacterium]
MIKKPKVLIVDDDVDVQNTIGDILLPDDDDSDDLQDLKSSLFGNESEEIKEEVVYDISYASQGLEAIGKVMEAKEKGEHFALAFMDVRMPPGIDGIMTAQKLWEIDPDIEIVLCSAYSDYTWDQVVLKLGVTDKLIILKKPFVPEEINQLALSLTKKWTIVNNLEEAVRERTIELEKANQSKNDFLAKMSHEIRTPMNAIMGFGDILQSAIKEDKYKEYLRAIAQSGRSLLRLINDILDISKIEAGQIDLKYGPIAIPKFFQECKGLFADRCDKKGLKFNLVIQDNFPGPLLLDELRLLQITLNILGNALKFTNQGSITLKAMFQKAKISGQFIDFSFSITDTGTGIAQSSIYKIFDKFFQVKERATQSMGGTGLGLSITKDLIELMKGDIRVLSEEGKGTTFTVTFPNVEVTGSDFELQANEISPESYVFKNSKIVIIEDIEYNATLLRAYLEGYDLQLFFAKDGEAGLDLIKEHKPDLILTDIKMPLKDGINVINELKSNKKTNNIPIIITTAMAMHGEIEKLKTVCSSFLSKPISKLDIIETLALHLPSEIAEKTSEGKSVPSNNWKLTEKQIERMPELCTILKEDISKRIKKASKTQIIQDFIELASEIKSLGVEYNNKDLYDFAEVFFVSARNFDLKAVKKSIGELPDQIKKIEKIIKK